MALTSADKINGLHKATGANDAAKWLDAYSKANTLIYAVLYETSSGNNWGMTAVIPKAVIGSSAKRFMGGGYQSGTYDNKWFAFVYVSTTSGGGYIYYNGSELTPHSLEFYYD